MEETYLLSAWYNGKTHQVDYSPYGWELQNCVRSFSELKDELEKNFGCEQIVMRARNPVDELRPIRNNDELLCFVSHLPNRGTLSIDVTGRKVSKKEFAKRRALKLRETITRAVGLDDIPYLCLPPSVADSGYTPVDELMSVSNKSLAMIRRSREKLEGRISSNRHSAVEYYCAGSREVSNILAADIVQDNAEMDALGILGTSIETLRSVARHVAVPIRSIETAIHTIRHAAEHMNIVCLQTIKHAIASPEFCSAILLVAPDWDSKLNSDSNQAFLHKLNVMESPTPSAVNREMALTVALGTRILWMKLLERRDVNSGYATQTSEIVLDPKRSSEASLSTRKGLELLGHCLILDEPPITGVSLELNPGVFHQVCAS